MVRQVRVKTRRVVQHRQRYQTGSRENQSAEKVKETAKQRSEYTGKHKEITGKDWNTRRTRYADELAKNDGNTQTRGREG